MSALLGLCSERPPQKLWRCSKRKLIMLAPSAEGLGTLTGEIDPDRHKQFLTQLQSLRSKVYVNGGFSKPRELQRGQNWAPVDAQSWHLLSISSSGEVCGCLRLRAHRAGARYSELTVSHSPISRSWKWGRHVKQALNGELERAWRGGLRFIEVGGWALDPGARGSSEAVRMALASFAFGELLGGAIGVTTARARGSAPILRKIGGKPIEAIPAYYDRSYRCTLEILRLHSWDPNPRFHSWIGELRDELRQSPVIACHASVSGAEVPGRTPVSSELTQNTTDSRSVDGHRNRLKLSWRNDDVTGNGWDVEAGRFPDLWHDIPSADGAL